MTTQHRRYTMLGKAVIAAAGTNSTAVNISDVGFVAFRVGSGKASATLSVQASDDGGATWGDCYDDAGGQVTVTDANSPVGRNVNLGEKLAAYSLIRFVAGASQGSGLVLSVYGKS